MNRMRRTGGIGGVGALLLGLGIGLPLLWGQTPEETRGAIHSLRVQVEIEEQLLAADATRYRELANQRRRVAQLLDSLYARLDEYLSALEEEDLLPEEVAPLQARVEEQDRNIQTAEGRYDQLREELRRLRRQIHDHRRRLTLLRSKGENLRSDLPGLSEVVTGEWAVLILPMELRGAYTLKQSGTLVSGQYTLDGGWTGSLTGTLVDGRLFLQRIDSKLGKDVTYTGELSPDGTSIKGTWDSMDLSGGKPAFGTWLATRMTE